MRSSRVLVFLLTTVATTTSAQSGAANAPPVVTTHDNVQSAGALANGVLSVSLRAGVGRWYPEGQASPSRDIEALGEEGQAMMVPSPLIRARVGTVVKVSIRNTLELPLRVHGLCDLPGTCEPLLIAAGATGEAQFKLGAAGTFHYWASTRNQPLSVRDGVDSQLGGVIVADEAGVDPRERIFVLSMLRKEAGVVGTEIAVINGRSWPLSERLRHAVGDTVRWRIVNLSPSAHAMHLHGFYFTVESTGDGMNDTRSVTGGTRGVTARVTVGGTFAMSWVPERQGNWLFHCHMLEHMLPNDHGGNAPAHADTTAAGMAGLVLGVHVTGPANRETIPDNARRKFQFTINPDIRLGDVPSYRVDISEAGAAALPRVNERAAPGPILVVTRGQPVAVEILNHMNEPTAIHWHGLELESYDDGVADFGGSPGSITPPVAPHGTFTARFTPPRAGTFIYHTHWHNPGQLSGGIYGPLIVLEPGQPFDPESDHIVMLGLEGKYRNFPNEPFAVNGENRPRPLELKAGIPHRLRFINITGDGVGLTVQLLSVHDPIRWAPLAKDGAEVPVSQRSMRPARQQIGVGETYDFELAPVTPRADGLWMELRRGSGELVFQWPVRIR